MSESVSESLIEPTSAAKPSVLDQIRSFERPFWAANIMELIERLAYYGVRVVIPIYIASSEDPGGLHFTNTQKGQILAVWALVQALLPMFTGGFADRYGRKPTIAVSIAIKMLGYFLMATQRSYWGFFLGCQMLAMGTAVFKPGVQGTLVEGTTKENSSVGWGIFYQVVNIGGALGPMLAGYLHRLAWRWVFFACMGIVALNYLTLFTYKDKPATKKPPEPEPQPEPLENAGYRESARAQQADAPKAGDALRGGSPLEVLTYSVKTMFRPRLIVFILVMSGFWVMFMQLFDALPNFIEEWVDSSGVVHTLGLKEGLFAAMTPRGLQVPQEWMINLDAIAIVVLMIPIAAATAHIKRLRAIFIGIFVACVGLMLAGFTTSGALCLLGILVFAVGEMTASPKMNEYLGVIAPKGEEALYMGYANVPVAIGWVSGTYIAGFVYDALADKANLALRYLRDVQHVPADVVDKIPRTGAMDELCKATHLDQSAATRLLFEHYHPQQFWYGFVVVGLLSAIGMVVYARVAQRWTHENA